jgi:hypothetical protein
MECSGVGGFEFTKSVSYEIERLGVSAVQSLNEDEFCGT